MCLQFNGLRFSTSTPTTQCIQLFDSKFPAVFHCQKVTDHSPCLPHFLLLNAESKSSSRTDEIRHYGCHVKFENNTSGRARLWDTALKFLCPGLSITSPDHLEVIIKIRALPFWLRMASCSAIITSAEVIIAAASRFVDVPEEEINLMKENAIPRNTKHATKFGMTLFKGKM